MSSVTRTVPDIAKLEIRERGEKAEMSRLQDYGPGTGETKVLRKDESVGHDIKVS